MADIELVVDNRVRVVESIEQMTLPAGDSITAGQAVRIDGETGRFVLAKATDETEANFYGTATRSVGAGEALTAIAYGVMDGYDLDDLDYGDPVYLSDDDGGLSDAPGTVEVQVGMVIPGTATTLGTAYDKLLRIVPARTKVVEQGGED